MKENDRDLELLLKNKMDELSESVDCFDRISARVFSEEDQDFSESGYTVSDLETLSPRRRFARTLKWTAAAVAAAICIAFIPMTGIPKKILADLGSGKSNALFDRLIDEIRYETRVNDYVTLELPLQQYLDYDVLVTPLLCCPFDGEDADGRNVQLFIRQIDGIDTNQVYAVEYMGDPTDNNVVAVAATKYRFSDEEISRIKCSDFQFIDNTGSIVAHFNDTSNVFTDSYGNENVIASFSHPMYYKDSKDSMAVTADVLYGHDSDEYFYDIRAYSYLYPSAGSVIDLAPTCRSDIWDVSVYRDGSSAFPDSDVSLFKRVSLFSNRVNTSVGGIAYVFPYDDDSSADYDVITGPDEKIEFYLTLEYNGDSCSIQSIIPPARTCDKGFMTVYVPYNGDLDNYILTVDSPQNGFGFLVNKDDYISRQKSVLSKQMDAAKDKK